MTVVSELKTNKITNLQTVTFILRYIIKVSFNMDLKKEVNVMCTS